MAKFSQRQQILDLGRQASVVVSPFSNLVFVEPIIELGLHQSFLSKSNYANYTEAKTLTAKNLF